MRVTISGVHTETGSTLKDHTESKMEGLTKYFDKVIDVTVTFAQEKHHHHLHRADVTVHANGIVLRAEGTGIDFYAAIDEAALKLGRQLERYKGRLHKHRERRQKFADQIKGFDSISVVDATMEDGALEEADVDVFGTTLPDIIKKEVGRIDPMSVDEAVMQMDLLNKPAFLFLNVSSGKLNMVYREGENTVRWVAPS
jgi:putative sigma-54 modulation protein